MSALKALAVILLVCTVCTVAKKVCITEDFTEFGCNQNIPNGTPVFNGKATLTKTIGSAPLSVYVAGTEECEFSFGPCSTFNIDSAGKDVFIGSDNQYEIVFTFAQKFRTFSIAKIYGLGVLDIKFKKNGNIILSDSVNRNPETNPNIDCAVGSTASWEPPHGGFDQVIITGGIFGLVDITACYNGAAIFSGGDDDDDSHLARGVAPKNPSYQEVQEGVCVTCTDALGQTHYQMYVCDDNNECGTETFSAADCTEISGTSIPVELTVDRLQELYPTANSVCVLTSDVPSAPVPSPKDSTVRHSEL